MDETTMEILRDAKHGPCLKQAFLKLYEEKILCDVTLTSSSGDELQAHWLVLSAHSDFLRHLAVSRSVMQFMMTESGSLKINIETETLKTILDYLYSGDLVVTKQNLHKIKQAAKVLQLSRALVLLEQSHLSCLGDQSHDAESRILQPMTTQADPKYFPPLSVSTKPRDLQPVTVSNTCGAHQSKVCSAEALQPTIWSVTSLNDNQTAWADPRQIFPNDDRNTASNQQHGDRFGCSTENSEEVQAELGWQNLRNISTDSIHIVNKTHGIFHEDSLDNSTGKSRRSDCGQSPVSPHSCSDHEYEQQSVVDTLSVSRKRGRPSAPIIYSPSSLKLHKKGRPLKVMQGPTNPDESLKKNAHLPNPVHPRDGSVLTNVGSDTVPHVQSPPTRPDATDTSASTVRNMNELQVQVQGQKSYTWREMDNDDSLFDFGAVKVEVCDVDDEDGDYSVHENTMSPVDERDENSFNSHEQFSPEGNEVSEDMNDTHSRSFQQERNPKRKRDDSILSSHTRSSSHKLLKTLSASNSIFRVDQNHEGNKISDVSPLSKLPSSTVRQCNLRAGNHEENSNTGQEEERQQQNSSVSTRKADKLLSGAHHDESHVTSPERNLSISHVQPNTDWVDISKGGNSVSDGTDDTALAVHVCDFCGNSYAYVTSLLRHIKMKHNNKLKTKKNKFRFGTTIMSKKMLDPTGERHSDQLEEGTGEESEMTVHTSSVIDYNTEATIPKQNTHYISGNTSKQKPEVFQLTAKSGIKKRRRRRKFRLSHGKRCTKARATSIQNADARVPVLTTFSSGKVSDVSGPIHPCNLCGNTYQYRSTLRRHIVLNHAGSFTKRSRMRFVKRDSFGKKLLQSQSLKTQQKPLDDDDAYGRNRSLTEIPEEDNASTKREDDSADKANNSVSNGGENSPSFYECHLCGVKYKYRSSLYRHNTARHRKKVLTKKSNLFGKRLKQKVFSKPKNKQKAIRCVVSGANLPDDVASKSVIDDTDSNITDQDGLSLGGGNGRGSETKVILKDRPKTSMKSIKGKTKTPEKSDLTCKFCNKSFTRVSTVTQHVRAVHMLKCNYVCLCKKGFNWSSAFSNHKKTCFIFNNKQH